MVELLGLESIIYNGTNEKGISVQTIVINILTQKTHDSAHRNTELTIDWSGITEADLRFLAQAHIVMRAQHMMRLSNEMIPERMSISVRDFLHPDKVIDSARMVHKLKSDIVRTTYKDSNVEDKPVRRGKVNQIDKILDTMSESDRAALVKMLAL